MQISKSKPKKSSILCTFKCTKKILAIVFEVKANRLVPILPPLFFGWTISLMAQYKYTCSKTQYKYCRALLGCEKIVVVFGQFRGSKRGFQGRGSEGGDSLVENSPLPSHPPPSSPPALQTIVYSHSHSILRYRI